MAAKKMYIKLWRDIRKQKWQFAALTLIILLGVLSYGGMIGVIDDMETSLRHTLDMLAFQDFQISLQEPVSATTIQQINSLDNVQAVTGRLVVDTGLEQSKDHPIHARLIGMPTEGQPQVNQLHIKEGRYFEPQDGLVAILDHHFADYYDYAPGTILHPIINGKTLDVPVVGVSVSAEYLLAMASDQNVLPDPSNFAVLYLPQAELQKLLGTEGKINDLNIRLTTRDPAATTQAIAQAKAALGDIPIRSIVRQKDNPGYKLVMMDLEDGREMMGAVPMLFLLIAAMSIYVFLNRLVQAQRAEIGVLRALGYSRWAVMRYYLLLAAIIALIGSGMGLFLSYPAGRSFAQAYAAEFGLPFVVTKFHTDAALSAVGLNILICLLAAWLSAWASAKLSPAQAMRFDPAVTLVKGRIPLGERVLSRFVPLRMKSKIAIRNLSRSRQRTLTAAMGFMFAFIVLLACWALFDGLGYIFDLQFNQIDRWDAQAIFSRPQTPALLDKVSQWDEVQKVEPVIVFPVTLKSTTDSKDVYLTAINPDTTLYGFHLAHGKTADEVLQPGHVLISENLGEKLGVHTGETLTLQTPYGSRNVIAETSNREVMSGGAYVNLAWLQKEMKAGSYFNGLLLKVTPEQQDALRKQLYRLPCIAQVDLKSEMLAGWKSLTGLYNVMMGFFLFFALLMAGAVIFNTITVNVLERQRELATMRTLGQSRGWLMGLITLENMLIGLLSLVPGIGLGIATTYQLFQVFNQSGDFYIPFYIAPQSYIIVTLLIFGTALLSQIPAMHKVNRMDLAEATKVMT